MVIRMYTRLSTRHKAISSIIGLAIILPALLITSIMIAEYMSNEATRVTLASRYIIEGVESMHLPILASSINSTHLYIGNQASKPAVISAIIYENQTSNATIIAPLDNKLYLPPGDTMLVDLKSISNIIPGNNLRPIALITEGSGIIPIDSPQFYQDATLAAKPLKNTTLILKGFFHGGLRITLNNEGNGYMIRDENVVKRVLNWLFSRNQYARLVMYALYPTQYTGFIEKGYPYTLNIEKASIERYSSETKKQYVFKYSESFTTMLAYADKYRYKILSLPILDDEVSIINITITLKTYTSVRATSFKISFETNSGYVVFYESSYIRPLRIRILEYFENKTAVAEAYDTSGTILHYASYNSILKSIKIETYYPVYTVYLDILKEEFISGNAYLNLSSLPVKLVGVKINNSITWFNSSSTLSYIGKGSLLNFGNNRIYYVINIPSGSTPMTILFPQIVRIKTDLSTHTFMLLEEGAEYITRPYYGGIMFARSTDPSDMISLNGFNTSVQVIQNSNACFYEVYLSNKLVIEGLPPGAVVKMNSSDVDIAEIVDASGEVNISIGYSVFGSLEIIIPNAVAFSNNGIEYYDVIREENWFGYRLVVKSVIGPSCLYIPIDKEPASVSVDNVLVNNYDILVYSSSRVLRLCLGNGVHDIVLLFLKS